jgi:hypothetical protein
MKVAPMKSALEMRQQQVWNPYAFQMHAQMQAQRAQQMALQHQAMLAQRTSPPSSPPKAPTNHSISAMINEQPTTPNSNYKISIN